MPKITTLLDHTPPTIDNAEAKKVTTRPGPNGTTIYTMNLGYATPDMVGDFMRFGQHDLTIKTGDTVEWVQKSMDAPHTVSFFSGGKEPDLAIPEPQPNGPPKLVLNPQVVTPAGGKVYSGKGVFNSGQINGTMNPAPGPRTYSLTFDTSGKFDYICIYHDQEGMDGYINVEPANAGQTSGPGLPDTGIGGAKATDNFTTWLVLGVVVGLMALSAAFFVLSKIRPDNDLD